MNVRLRHGSDRHHDIGISSPRVDTMCSEPGCGKRARRRGQCYGCARKRNAAERVAQLQAGELVDPRRERALKIHASDPELPLRDLALRLGLREHTVGKWVHEETRADKKR